MLFCDTSALYAVLDADDENHDPARRTWTELLERRTTVSTTNYVVLECFALIQHRLGLAALQVFVADIVPVLQMEWVTPDDHNGAVQAVLAASQRRLSLVDCASFAIMRRLGLEKAFTFDRHFRQYGFQSMP